MVATVGKLPYEQNFQQGGYTYAGGILAESVHMLLGNLSRVYDVFTDYWPLD
jgi:hypothetical protein